MKLVERETKGVVAMAKRDLDIFRLSERLMRMDDNAWARHSNPKSVYSRIALLPLISLAIWSRVWLGWASLIPIALCLIWTWWNPRAFPAPRHTDNWASQGTFGERVFLQRGTLPIPRHHQVWARILTIASAIGIVPWAYGLWALNVPYTLLGLALMVGGKIWFVDRMVWLYQDMKEKSPEYGGWLR